MFEDLAGADAAGLADAVTEVLTDQLQARRLAKQARAVVRRDHDWAAIAARTIDVFARAEPQERALRAELAGRTAPRLVVRDGNLLTGQSS